MSGDLDIAVLVWDAYVLVVREVKYEDHIQYD